MGFGRFISRSCAVCAALGAAQALAIGPSVAPDISVQQVLQGSLQGPVRSIEAADRIDGWKHLDDQHVVLQMGSDDQYLLTLRDRCLGLSWARNVGVTMSNNTIWAGFDAITVDGDQCQIESINPLDSPDR